jgi:catechol 2,3-dioxygenase-like lactoylglutathione lyase family enzyme
MLTHLMLGAEDPAASAKFFEAVLGPLGYARAFEMGGRVGFSCGEGQPPLIVGKPGDGASASFGNGAMIGFRAENPEKVQEAYKAGLAAGGKDEGAPGPRPMGPPGTYAAYLRDPTGNKIGVFCTIPQG